jgi:hypothetical protein
MRFDGVGGRHGTSGTADNLAHCSHVPPDLGVSVERGGCGPERLGPDVFRRKVPAKTQFLEPAGSGNLLRLQRHRH